jgi:hypothetical protein
MRNHGNSIPPACKCAVNRARKPRKFLVALSCGRNNAAICATEARSCVMDLTQGAKNERPQAEPPTTAVPPRPFEEASHVLVVLMRPRTSQALISAFHKRHKLSAKMLDIIFLTRLPCRIGMEIPI